MSRPKIFVPPQKSKLARLYRSNTDAQIAAVMGCTEAVVKNWRRAYSIKGIRRSGAGLGAPRRFERPSAETLRGLTETNTDQEIAQMFGCSRKAITKWRTFYGIQKSGTVYRRRPWAHGLNEDFFATIDTEQKAYILGMLATDGCVYNNRIFLCLQARDEHILSETLAAMQSASSVHERPKGSFPGSGPMKYIAFTSRKLASDLAALGIVPKKSHTLTYAKVPHHLERHYVRGLFDGDGSIHPKGIFYFLGTEALIDGVTGAISRHTGIVLAKKPAGKLYRASGYGGSRKVLSWMYRNASIFLRRKKKIFDESW